MSLKISGKAGFSADRLKRVPAKMRSFVDSAKIPGYVAAIVRKGETVYSECYGLGDLENSQPMEPDTIFRIKSMTKIITAVAAMTLYEEGHFNLNTPICEFLPGFKNMTALKPGAKNFTDTEPLARPITFRHLFTHTSGIIYGGYPFETTEAAYANWKKEAGVTPENETLAALTTMLQETPLAFQPGTRFGYGFSTDLLGSLIEVLSGQPLDRFFKERILDPMGMVDTDFEVPPSKAERLASVYGPSPEGHGLVCLEKAGESPYLRTPTLLSGGGGLVSTLSDYGKFLQMLLDGGRYGSGTNGGRILAPSTVELFSQNLAPEEVLPFNVDGDEDLYHRGYGFSLATRVLTNVGQSGQAGSPSEFGWDGYYCTHCWADPAKQLYGLFLTQLAPFNLYKLADSFKQLTYQALEE